MSVQGAALPDLLAPRFDRREVSLWVGAAVLVVGLHAGAALLAERWRETLPALDSAPPSVMLELAPMAVAPEAIPEDVAELVDSAAATDPVEEPLEMAEPVPLPTTEPVVEESVTEQVVERVEPDVLEAPVEIPETSQAEPLEQPDEIVPETSVAEPEPIEPEQVVPETVTAESVEQEVVEEVEEVIPDLVEAPLPEVAMALPTPRPDVVEPEVERPVAEEEPAKPARKAAPKAARKPAPAASTPRKKSAVASEQTAAPKSQGAGASVSPARWQSRVNAHLNRHKRFPRGSSANGTVSVRFAINSGGAVLSVSVARSSGDPDLDQAAVDMVRRASPVPAPPPAIARARMSLTVPVRFSRR